MEINDAIVNDNVSIVLCLSIEVVRYQGGRLVHELLSSRRVLFFRGVLGRLFLFFSSFRFVFVRR